MSGTGTAGGRIAPGVGANLLGQHSQDRNQEATVYVGNLDPQVRTTHELCACFGCRCPGVAYRMVGPQHLQSCTRTRAS